MGQVTHITSKTRWILFEIVDGKSLTFDWLQTCDMVTTWAKQLKNSLPSSLLVRDQWHFSIYDKTHTVHASTHMCVLYTVWMHEWRYAFWVIVFAPSHTLADSHLLFWGHNCVHTVSPDCGTSHPPWLPSYRSGSGGNLICHVFIQKDDTQHSHQRM